MSKGPESRFRHGFVIPGLKTIERIYIMPIQQQGIVGDPDLICCINGRFVALELKAENGKIGKLQKYKLDKITESGGIAFEVRPSNWDKILETLKKL